MKTSKLAGPDCSKTEERYSLDRSLSANSTVRFLNSDPLESDFTCWIALSALEQQGPGLWENHRNL